MIVTAPHCRWAWIVQSYVLGNAHMQPSVMPSVLWLCWLGGRKGIRPVKKQSGGILAWLSVWDEVQIICILPSRCHCHSLSLASVKSRLVMVSAHTGNSGQSREAVKWTCVPRLIHESTGTCESAPEMPSRLVQRPTQKQTHRQWPCYINTNAEIAWIYYCLESWQCTLITQTQQQQQNSFTYIHRYTHTHTCLMALCPGLPRWVSTRKTKPIWIYWSKREWVAILAINLVQG